MYVLLASLVKCALNRHISTKTRAPFKLKHSKVSKFCRLALFLHGGSDKQPVFIAVGQTSDFFPFLSWQMIPSGRPMLSYTVNMKMRQKMAQGLLFNMLNEWVSLHCFIHGLITTCLNFLAFYQIHHGCGEWENESSPPPTKMLKKSAYTIIIDNNK